jgi:DNA-binding CsgD family transcriptional regulator
MHFVAFSLFAAALFCLSAALLPRQAAWCMLAVAPFVLVYCLAHSFDSSIQLAEKSMRQESASTNSPVPFLLLVAVLGLSGGLLRSLVSSSLQTMPTIWAFPLSTTVAALGLFFSKAPSRDDGMGLFYRSIACVAVAFMVLTIVSTQSVFAFSIHTAGFTYFYGLLWVFCVLNAQMTGMPTRTFTGGFLANQIGQLAGAAAGGALNILLDAGSIAATATNLVLYAFLFVTIVILARLGRSASGGVARPPAESRESITRALSIEEACHATAIRFGLTDREEQVLEQLVGGYDRAYIAQVLGVSIETVKTHTRHIYEKLGAHSRIEVFQTVAEFRNTR